MYSMTANVLVLDGEQNLQIAFHLQRQNHTRRLSSLMPLWDNNNNNNNDNMTQGREWEMASKFALGTRGACDVSGVCWPHTHTK